LKVPRSAGDLRPEGRLSPAEWVPRSRALGPGFGYTISYSIRGGSTLQKSKKRYGDSAAQDKVLFCDRVITMWFEGFVYLVYFFGWVAETACFVILLVVLSKGPKELRRHNQTKESVLAEIRDRLPTNVSWNSK
jgi:hypothetical protein